MIVGLAAALGLRPLDRVQLSSRQDIANARNRCHMDGGPFDLSWGYLAIRIFVWNSSFVFLERVSHEVR